MGDQELLKKFYDQVGENYPEEEYVYHTLRGRLRKKFVVDWLAQQSGCLLEIGTNRGMYLQHYDGGTRFGVDLSRSVLRAAHRAKPVFYAVADAERLFCFKSGAFDRVLCSEVIEHCFSPEAVFRSIAHVLKPNGCALLTTPNYRRKRPTWVGLDAMQNYGITSTWQEKYFHTAYRPQELVDFAQQAGLEVVQSGTLEKEIKYLAKIPAAFLLFGRALNKLFKSRRFAAWNETFFQRLSNFLYDMTRATLFEKAALLFVKEGGRSFIMVKKKL